jgi:glutathione synthase
MKQQHLFIIDPLESLRWELDTSLGLARALRAAGHEVWICEISQLSWSSTQSEVHAEVQRLDFAADGHQPLCSGARERRSAASFASVQMRKDPPVDTGYWSCTWLLDSLRRKTRVFNPPTALRTLNEKLGIFSFAEDAHPALVSADPEQLFAYIEKECAGDGISKPLDSFGGRGVVRINLAKMGRDAALALLRTQCAEGKELRMVQAFCDKIFQGEVRVFAVGGVPLAWCLKKPAKGNYLANTSQGATLSSYTPSKALQERISRISQQLWQKHGIAFVGFDVIDERISEVNITSPRLLQGADDHSDYYRPMAQWLLDQCLIPLSEIVRK